MNTSASSDPFSAFLDSLAQEYKQDLKAFEGRRREKGSKNKTIKYEEFLKSPQTSVNHQTKREQGLFSAGQDMAVCETVSSESVRSSTTKIKVEGDRGQSESSSIPTETFSPMDMMHMGPSPTFLSAPRTILATLDQNTALHQPFGSEARVIINSDVRVVVPSSEPQRNEENERPMENMKGTFEVLACTNVIIQNVDSQPKAMPLPHHCLTESVVPTKTVDAALSKGPATANRRLDFEFSSDDSENECADGISLISHPQSPSASPKPVVVNAVNASPLVASCPDYCVPLIASLADKAACSDEEEDTRSFTLPEGTPVRLFVVDVHATEDLIRYENKEEASELGLACDELNLGDSHVSAKKKMNKYISKIKKNTKVNEEKALSQELDHSSSRYHRMVRKAATPRAGMRRGTSIASSFDAKSQHAQTLLSINSSTHSMTPHSPVQLKTQESRTPPKQELPILNEGICNGEECERLLDPKRLSRPPNPDAWLFSPDGSPSTLPTPEKVKALECVCDGGDDKVDDGTEDAVVIDRTTTPKRSRLISNSLSEVCVTETKEKNGHTQPSSESVVFTTKIVTQSKEGVSSPTPHVSNPSELFYSLLLSKMGSRLTHQSSPSTKADSFQSDSVHTRSSGVERPSASPPEGDSHAFSEASPVLGSASTSFNTSLLDAGSSPNPKISARLDTSFSPPPSSPLPRSGEVAAYPAIPQPVSVVPLPKAHSARVLKEAGAKRESSPSPQRFVPDEIENQLKSPGRSLSPPPDLTVIRECNTNTKRWNIGFPSSSRSSSVDVSPSISLPVGAKNHGTLARSPSPSPATSCDVYGVTSPAPFFRSPAPEREQLTYDGITVVNSASEQPNTARALCLTPSPVKKLGDEGSDADSPPPRTTPLFLGFTSSTANKSELQNEMVPLPTNIGFYSQLGFSPGVVTCMSGGSDLLQCLPADESPVPIRISQSFLGCSADSTAANLNPNTEAVCKASALPRHSPSRRPFATAISVARCDEHSSSGPREGGSLPVQYRAVGVLGQNQNSMAISYLKRDPLLLKAEVELLKEQTSKDGCVAKDGSDYVPQPLLKMLTLNNVAETPIKKSRVPCHSPPLGSNYEIILDDTAMVKWAAKLDVFALLGFYSPE